jgi:hypothetical protein
VANNELVVLESCRRHEPYFVVSQVGTNVRELQIIAAYCQERVSACLRKVIENVVFRRHKRLPVWRCTLENPNCIRILPTRRGPLAQLTTRRLMRRPRDLRAPFRISFAVVPESSRLLVRIFHRTLFGRHAGQMPFQSSISSRNGSGGLSTDASTRQGAKVHRAGRSGARYGRLPLDK